MRWRTEEEVLAGTGEETCGNTRCADHHSRSSRTLGDDEDERPPRLSTIELPFMYEERGVRKEALVKVVLCHPCLQKLMYKREKRTREARKLGERVGDEQSDGKREERRKGERDLAESEHAGGHKRRKSEAEMNESSELQRRDDMNQDDRRRRRSSRSRSPRERREDYKQRRRDHP